VPTVNPYCVAGAGTTIANGTYSYTSGSFNVFMSGYWQHISEPNLKMGYAMMGTYAIYDGYTHLYSASTLTGTWSMVSGLASAPTVIAGDCTAPTPTPTPTPNTLRIKRSSTTTVVPTTLLEGELAANIIDKKIWIGSSSQAPVLISDINGSGGGIALTDISSSAVGLNYDYTTGNFSTSQGYEIPLTSTLSSITTAYNERLQWDGSATSLITATGRTSLGIGNVENTALSTWAGTTNITAVGAVLAKSVTINTPSASGSQGGAFVISAGTLFSLTASVESPDININLQRAVQFKAGNLSLQRAIRIQAPTYSFISPSTLTTAVTVQIDSAPVASSGATLTNAYALRVLTGSTTGVGIAIQGAASQTGDLFQIQNSSFTNLFSINSNGSLSLSPFGTVAGNTNELRFLELYANGQNYVGFKASDSIASNVIWTLPAADGTAGQVLSTNASGILSWATPSSGGGATLNGITAATANQTGITNANFGIRWNWARTTDTTSALELGETTAATTGTSTSGVPNQVGLKLSTLAASTMSPLSVYSRASHVFSVSPTTPQILAASGSGGVPAYSFAESTNTGLSLTNTDRLVMSAAGTQVAFFHPSCFSFYVDGTAAWPAIQSNSSTCGIFFASGAVGISTNPAGMPIENARFAGEGILQTSRGSPDTTSYAINSRKSRGTVAAPTIITTGDDLLTMSGFGYVGATNTYLEASRITFDSIGTISDTSTGIGGTINFLTRDVGGAVTSKFTMTNKGELLVAGAAGATGQVLTSAGSGAAPTWSTVTAGSSVTTSATAPATPTAGNQWYDTTTGIIYTYVNDGTSSQWVQGSTATLATGVPAGGTTNQFLVKSSATDYATAWTGTLLNPTFTNYTETMFQASGSGAWSIDLSQGTIQKFNYNGNYTLTLPTSIAGKSFVIIVQYQTNGLSTTWSSVSPLKWAGGTTPTATGVSGKIDIYTFFQDGTNTYGTVYGQNF
jgi:hypothetical protein